MRNNELALRNYNEFAHQVFGKFDFTGKLYESQADGQVGPIDFCWDCKEEIRIWNSTLLPIRCDDKETLVVKAGRGENRRVKNVGITSLLLCEECTYKRISRLRMTTESFRGKVLNIQPSIFFLVSTRQINNIIKNSKVSFRFLGEQVGNGNFRKKIQNRKDCTLLTDIELRVIIDNCISGYGYSISGATKLLLDASTIQINGKDNLTYEYLEQLPNLILEDSKLEDKRNSFNHLISIPIVGFTYKHEQYSPIFAEYGICGELSKTMSGGASYLFLKNIGYTTKRVKIPDVNTKEQRLVPSYMKSLGGYKHLDHDLFVWPHEQIVMNAYLRSFIPDYKEPSLIKLLRTNLTLDYQKGYEF